MRKTQKIQPPSGLQRSHQDCSSQGDPPRRLAGPPRRPWGPATSRDSRRGPKCGGCVTRCPGCPPGEDSNPASKEVPPMSRSITRLAPMASSSLKSPKSALRDYLVSGFAQASSGWLPLSPTWSGDRPARS